jgi:hypothetical protein
MTQAGLRNDRDAIISVVAEYYTFDDKYLRRAAIKNMDDPERATELEPIKHADWLFAYDTKKNIIYWRPH